MKWLKLLTDFGSRHRIGARILCDLKASGYGSFMLLLETVAGAMSIHTSDPVARFTEKHWASILRLKLSGLHKFLAYLQQIEAVQVERFGNELQIRVPILLELAHEKAVSSKVRGPSRGPKGGFRGYEKTEQEQIKIRIDDRRLQKRDCGRAASTSVVSLSEDDRPNGTDFGAAAQAMVDAYLLAWKKHTGQQRKFDAKSKNWPAMAKAANYCDELGIDYAVYCETIFEWYAEAGIAKRAEPMFPFPNQLIGETAESIISDHLARTRGPLPNPKFRSLELDEA